jgi:hypothetical protein
MLIATAGLACGPGAALTAARVEGVEQAEARVEAQEVEAPEVGPAAAQPATSFPPTPAQTG